MDILESLYVLLQALRCLHLVIIIIIIIIIIIVSFIKRKTTE